MPETKQVTIDLATVEAREKELDTRYTRMDSDMSEFYNLSDYTLKNHADKKVPGSYPITSNRSRVFADRVISALQGCKIKCDVTVNGEANAKSRKIEKALEAMRWAIDLYLTSMGYPTLMAFMAGQITTRGGISLLCYPYESEGLLIPHVGLWDWRYVATSLGKNGLDFGSHRMTKTAAQIRKEHDVEIKGDEGELVDLWCPGKHVLYIDDETASGLKPETGLDYTPVIEALCNLTAFTQDDDYEAYMGESVWAALRDTYKERNRQLSIRNSLAMRGLTRSLEYHSSQGEGAVVDAKQVMADSSVIAVEKDGGFKWMPESDINQAAVEMLQVLEQDTIFGGLSTLEYGEMPNDMTAAQLNTVLSKTMSFLNPRRIPMEKVLEDMSYMFLGQMKDRGLPKQCRIGRRLIEIPDFEIDESVDISYELVVELPQQVIANYSINAAARGEISKETRLRDILQVEDPEGEISKLRIETLEAIDPRLAAFLTVRELLESKDPDEQALGAFAIRLLGFQPEPQPPMPEQAATGQPTPGQGQPRPPMQGQPQPGMQDQAMLKRQMIQQAMAAQTAGKGPMPSQAPAKPNPSALPALLKGQ